MIHNDLSVPFNNNNCYNPKNIDRFKRHQLVVNAINSCGKAQGEYIEIPIAFLPDAPQMDVTTEGCSIVVTWVSDYPVRVYQDNVHL